jgi:hypothetical protein
MDFKHCRTSIVTANGFGLGRRDAGQRIKNGTD